VRERDRDPGVGVHRAPGTTTPAASTGPIRTLFSSDPATIQHVGVDLVAYLQIIAGHH
jgi:hypothetical protein